MRAGRLQFWLAFVCSGALAGCSVVGSLFGTSKPTTTLNSMQVMAASEANEGLATAIDVLFVYDNGVLPLLPADAPTWFQQREGLRNTLGRDVDIVTLEVPSPYNVVTVEMPARSRHALRVLAYANYLARSGQARIDLTEYGHVTLRLLADRIDTIGG